MYAYLGAIELLSSKGMQYKSSILFTIALWPALSADELCDIQTAVLFWCQAVLPRVADFIIPGTEDRLTVKISLSLCGVCIMRLRQVPHKLACTPTV